MKIKQFIEKAIEGGWTTSINYMIDEYGYIHNLEEMLLDPLAWQAVGKALNKKYVCSGCGFPYKDKTPTGNEIWDSIHCKKCEGFCEWWFFAFTKMPEALAEGKSIEEYIETL